MSFFAKFLTPVKVIPMLTTESIVCEMEAMSDDQEGKCMMPVLLLNMHCLVV
jgi:hypothetical protein